MDEVGLLEFGPGPRDTLRDGNIMGAGCYMDKYIELQVSLPHEHTPPAMTIITRSILGTVLVVRRALNILIAELYPRLVRAGPSFRQTRRRIREGGHATVAALAQVAAVSTEIEKGGDTMLPITIKTDKGDQTIPVTQWTLAFVAKEFIRTGRPEFDQPLSRGLIAFYSNWYTSIIDPPSPASAFSRTARKRRALSILIRMDYEQLALQRLSYVAEVARTLILLEDTPPLLSNNSYDPRTEFPLISGLTIHECIGLGMAAYTRSHNPTRHTFTAPNLTPSGVSGGTLSARNVTHFLDHVSASYRTLQVQIATEEKQLPGMEKYALNPLFKWPIVRTHLVDPNGEPILVAPIPSLILYRVTHGLYWDLLDRWSRNSAASPTPIPDFPSYFGRAFEHYVGQLLAEFIPPPCLIPEQEYGPRTERRRSCDWIVLEGDTAILLECKTSRLHKTTKATGDPEDFLEQASDTYAKAVVQILRTKRAIEAKALVLPSTPKGYLAMVVLFDHLLTSAVHLKEDLRHLVPRMDNSFSPSDVDAIDYRIIPIRILENFAPKFPSVGLSGAFVAANWNQMPERNRSSPGLPLLLTRRFDLFEQFMRSAFP